MLFVGVAAPLTIYPNTDRVRIATTRNNVVIFFNIDLFFIFIPRF